MSDLQLQYFAPQTHPMERLRKNQFSGDRVAIINTRTVSVVTQLDLEIYTAWMGILQYHYGMLPDEASA